MKQLKERVAVVTGAASGVGRATAELLARRGCHLALVDVNESGLDDLQHELLEHGGRVTVHVADVADRVRMQALPAEVIAEHGAVHILVNNAGVTVAATFEDHTIDDLHWIIGINLFGVLYGCKVFLPELRRADEAHIVNVSSMFGFVGAPTQSTYCATKFAVRGFSEALWTELRGSGIGVTSIHPGGVQTGITRTMRSYDERVRDATISGIERSRPPERVAEAIVRGIEGDKLRVIVGWESYLTEWLKRLMPVMLHRMIARGTRDGLGA